MGYDLDCFFGRLKRCVPLFVKKGNDLDCFWNWGVSPFLYERGGVSLFCENGVRPWFFNWGVSPFLYERGGVSLFCENGVRPWLFLKLRCVPFCLKLRCVPILYERGGVSLFLWKRGTTLIVFETEVCPPFCTSVLVCPCFMKMGYDLDFSTEVCPLLSNRGVSPFCWLV